MSSEKRCWSLRIQLRMMDCYDYHNYNYIFFLLQVCGHDHIHCTVPTWTSKYVATEDAKFLMFNYTLFIMNVAERQPL